METEPENSNGEVPPLGLLLAVLLRYLSTLITMIINSLNLFCFSILKDVIILSSTNNNVNANLRED